VKQVLGVAVVCGFLASVGLQTVRAAKEDKVLICHIPQGNVEQANEIVVAASAVPSHLAHGDKTGSCVSAAPPTCNDNPVCFQ